MKSYKHQVSPEETIDLDFRVDKYISDNLSLFTRSQLKSRLVKVLINGKESKLSRKVKPGDNLEIFYIDPPAMDMAAENIYLDILYEDKNVIVINKQQGLVVHPCQGRYTGTLVNALLYYIKGFENNFQEKDIRPGIVHRLDKDTSGVMIIAKNKETCEFLSDQFRNRKIKKTYLAVIKGSPPESEGRIETGIKRDYRNRKRFIWCNTGGKHAVTLYKTIRSFTGYTLLAMKPKTGRTHQLRVHALSIRCPILGDPVYSRRDKNFPSATMMLHAYKLVIHLPGDEKKHTFSTPLPLRFKTLFEALNDSEL